MSRRRRKKNNGTLVFVLILTVLVLAAEAGFVWFMLHRDPVSPEQLQAAPQTVPTAAPTEPTAGAAPAVTALPKAAEETAASPLPETEAPTEPETEPETVPETEPQPQSYTLTFAGDCTLGSDPEHYGAMYSFIWTIGEDYDYPFRNVADYFRNDDFTIVNLEGVLSDSTTGHSSALFTFRGPTEYTKILTGSSVEAVTLANNHAMDYGKPGYESTKAALDAAEVTYVEKDRSVMYTTESGLTIGIYGGAFSFNGAAMREDIARMRREGADIIIAAVHWGDEGRYHPGANQVSFAHEMIDYGVDIVYGSHPHVLQRIEPYKDGIIYYSMGNFCFGGNHWPPDLDSVVLQQEVIREADGTVHLGELTRIPVSINSMKNKMQNNFQPTPYEEGSDGYNRVLAKLDETWKGADLVLSY